jgi:hypothetical protein
MVFSTYQKEADGLGLRLGISKSPVQGALIVYVEVTNNTGSDYVFSAKDLVLTTKADGKQIPTINPADYINAYQGEQTGLIAGMQAMAPTLKSIATISNATYANELRSTHAEHLATDSNTLEIANLVKGIARHTLGTSATVENNSKNYFYLFYQDMDTFPIEVKYGNLTYSFMGKSSYDRFADE